uniref:Uncharacterized protein n=1 Tax=Leersia perrieri TaxID=77586 RepID=A0A0D9WX30_9ORYZ
MTPGPAKDQEGRTRPTNRRLGDGDYGVFGEKLCPVTAVDAAIPSGAAAANAPPPPPSSSPAVDHAPGCGGCGTKRSAPASSPVGGREGKNTSAGIEDGANASSPPPAASPAFQRISKRLPRDHPGGAGRGAEGSASASPVGGRERKKTPAANASTAPPPATAFLERSSKRLALYHPGGGGRDGDVSAPAASVVDRKGKGKICAEIEGEASASSPLPPAGSFPFVSPFERRAALLHEDEAEVAGFLGCPHFYKFDPLKIGAQSEGQLNDFGTDSQEGSNTVRSSAVQNFSADFSWWTIMGNPMIQTIPGTCAIVASAVCIEALHRLEWERLHGPGTFPCRAAAPRKLRRACKQTNPPIWNPKDGLQKIPLLLKKIMELGGIPMTNAPPPAPFLLPLKSWKMYRRDGSLTPERAAHILRTHGPYIGILWVSLLYPFIDASVDDQMVYRFWFPPHLRRISDYLLMQYLFAGRLKDKDLDDLLTKILVLDNHTDTGPSRWIRFEELDKIYVLRVDPLPLDYLDPSLMYPASSY